MTSDNNFGWVNETLSYRRRTVLASIGAGTGVATIGGTAAAAAEEHDEDDEDSSEDDEGDDAAGDGEPDRNGEVRPTFGYAAESTDVEPPVEPDHEVELVVSKRDQEGVPFPEFHFDPVGLFVEPGETVQFTLHSPEHTVTAYHSDLGWTQRVPDGVGPISSPFLWTGSYFLYTFDEPGVYDLFCLPHEFFGMVIRLVVGEATGPGAEEVPEPAFVEQPPNPADPIPPDWLAATVFRDPAMDPENIVERGSVDWHQDLQPESKEFPMELLIPEDQEPETLAAVLTGDQHDVDTEAGGCAHFAVTDQGLAFDVVLEELSGVTQAHIREGDHDEDGPIVTDLFEFTEEVDGSGEGDPVDTEPDAPIVESGTVDDTEVVDRILEDPSAYYVDVHTIEYTGGEIRGQIRSHDGEEPADEEPDDEERDDEREDEPEDGTDDTDENGEEAGDDGEGDDEDENGGDE